MSSRKRSFYALSFLVRPGGSQRNLHYVRATLDEISVDLHTALMDGSNLYLLCWYGAELRLDTFQNGENVASLDLRPFLSIEIGGYPAIGFDAAGQVTGYDFRSGSEAEAADGSLAAKMFANDLDELDVTVAWPRIHAPPLTGRLVTPADVVSVSGNWFDDELSTEELLAEGYLPYGFSAES